MNSSVTLVDPVRGTFHQSIDADNPPTLAQLGVTLGGAFINPSASFFLNTNNGGSSPINGSYKVQVGDNISVVHQTKAGQ